MCGHVTRLAERTIKVHHRRGFMHLMTLRKPYWIWAIRDDLPLVGAVAPSAGSQAGW